MANTHRHIPKAISITNILQNGPLHKSMTISTSLPIILILSLICRCSTTNSHTYPPEIISYTEAASANKSIFHPRLLLLSHPYGDKVPPTPGDIVLYFDTDKTPPGSHHDEIQRKRIYDPSVVPNYQGELTCVRGDLGLGFYLWSVIKVLKEHGDEWCCQTGNDGRSIATYSRATVGLAGMRGWCVKCFDVGFAADEVMAGCSEDGGGGYLFNVEGSYPEVVVYNSEDRDLGDIGVLE